MKSTNLFTKGVSLSLGALFLLSTAPIFAQTSTPVEDSNRNLNGLTQQIQQKLEQRQELAAGRIQDRCAITTTRINLVTARYENNKGRHITRYNQTVERVQTLTTNLDSKGYNTEAVKTDLEVLNRYIRDFAGAYTEFINKIEESKSLACGDSEGAYRAKVEEARAELEDVREISLKIRTHIQTELRPSIQELRTQTPSVEGVTDQTL